MSLNILEKTNEQDDPSSDLDISSFIHRRLGAWDLYIKQDSWSWLALFTAPLGSLSTLSTHQQDLMYVMRTLRDLWSISSGYIVLYFLVLVPNMFLPSISLWYSGQLIKQVQITIETREFLQEELFNTIYMKFACSVLELILKSVAEKAESMLQLRTRRVYTARTIRAMSRLDIPTASDPIVQSKLAQLGGSAFTSGTSTHFTSATAAVDVLSQSMAIVSTVINLSSQVGVLFVVLRDQPDGAALAATTAVRYGLSLLYSDSFFGIAKRTWAATTENDAYIRMMGLYNSICYTKHRQEIYTNNLATFMADEFQALQDQLGDVDSQPFWDLRQDLFGSGTTMSQLRALLDSAFKELPKGVFMLRAIRTPLSIPVSMASLNVVEQSTSSFLQRFVHMRYQLYQLSNSMRSLRVLYEIEVVDNTVTDGKLPYPENTQSLRSGISVEFCDVSFMYPGKDIYAVRNVSFRVEAGQLCVIVGTNGSGKSTLLKLLTRVYDVTEGQILIDGRDIKSLKLHDLHRALSVLYQDYTHFQLSLRDNIAIGDPENAGDDDRVREAARLSGVDSIVDKLPEAYGTYLHRPVQDVYNNIPSGVQKLFGRETTLSSGMGIGKHDKTDTWLSGGQMQKLAVARTFMRSLPDDPRVGLLLFDEPSAHLDPRAEYDLFARLRTLRGEKTMFFSTHRFGNLTRHSDLILYMHDAAIIEAGTHEQLLDRGGQYAELWKLQAHAFM
ncbi:unnamed protein product [Peniophora sp. CBMAI 1063]|nr:unnamed protein product [Peniophora sp. CBMAI 1063]